VFVRKIDAHMKVETYRKMDKLLTKVSGRMLFKRLTISKPAPDVGVKRPFEWGDGEPPTPEIITIPFDWGDGEPPTPEEQTHPTIHTK
jgi:hypothetical protein